MVHEIYSLLGTKQLSSNILIVAVSNLSPGLYLIKVFTEEGNDTHSNDSLLVQA